MIQNFELLFKLIQSIKDKNAMNEKLSLPALDHTLTFNNTVNDNDVQQLLGKFDRYTILDPSHFLVNSPNYMYNLFLKVDFKQNVEIKLTSKVSGEAVKHAPSEEKTPEEVIIVETKEEVEIPAVEETIEITEVIKEEVVVVNESPEPEITEEVVAPVEETPEVKEVEEEKKAPKKGGKKQN